MSSVLPILLTAALLSIAPYAVQAQTGDTPEPAVPFTPAGGDTGSAAGAYGGSASFNQQAQPGYAPQYGGPAYGQPSYGGPGTGPGSGLGLGQQGYGQPGYNQPGYGGPGYGQQPSPAPYFQRLYGSPYGNQPPPYSYGGQPYSGGGAPMSNVPNYQAPDFAYAPQGMVLPVTLNNSISTQVARNGDLVQVTVSQNVALGGISYLPQGTVITGQITDAEPGRHFQRSGSLNMTFNAMRLRDGQTIPIQAHVLGSIGKYSQTSSGDYRGEGWGTKLGNLALRSAIGAGGGALFGTAIGAISHGGIGTGAWSGTAIGGGLGLADDLLLRKGRDILIHSGTPMQIQLDSPIQIPLQDVDQASTGAM